uniref:F-box domain-containing protein n=1 Tax=Timema monikensis TaxID=170555 RepID=A0A7R9EFH4_9NEOP|nr:unnamed protein product [Timema monikensis]
MSWLKEGYGPDGGMVDRGVRRKPLSAERYNVTWASVIPRRLLLMWLRRITNKSVMIVDRSLGCKIPLGMAAIEDKIKSRILCNPDPRRYSQLLQSGNRSSRITPWIKVLDDWLLAGENMVIMAKRKNKRRKIGGRLYSPNKSQNFVKAEMSSKNILDLPVEILLNIFSYLPLLDVLCHVQLVCKVWVCQEKHKSKIFRQKKDVSGTRTGIKRPKNKRDKDEESSSDGEEGNYLSSGSSNLEQIVGVIVPGRDDAECLLCTEKFPKSKTGELWVQCVVCRDGLSLLCTGSCLLHPTAIFNLKLVFALHLGRKHSIPRPPRPNEEYSHLCEKRVKNNLGGGTLSTAHRDLNPDLPVIGSAGVTPLTSNRLLMVHGPEPAHHPIVIAR